MSQYVGPKSNPANLATQGDLTGGAVEAWREVGTPGQPAFANSWVNSGGGAPTVAFYKDPYGVVRLKGWLKNGTIGTSAFTLPAGYRPTGQSEFAAVANGAFARLIIFDTGAVTLSIGSNVWFSLDGISFRAA